MQRLLLPLACTLLATPVLAGTGGLAADGCHQHQGEPFRHYPGTAEPQGVCFEIDGETVKIPMPTLEIIRDTLEPITVEVPVEVMVDPSPDLVKERDDAVLAAEAARRVASEANSQSLSSRQAMERALAAQEAAESDRDMHKARILELESGKDLCTQEQGIVLGAMGSWGTKLEEAAQKLVDCLNVGH